MAKTQTKGTRYVELPAEDYHTFLDSIGFKTIEIEGHEKVYVRAGRMNPSLVIKIYSSVAANATDARGCGEDAIRVSLYQRWPATANKRDRCLKKCSRIYRTGSVEAICQRTKERVTELANWAQEKIGTVPCRVCGTVTWKKGGRCLESICKGWAS